MRCFHVIGKLYFFWKNHVRVSRALSGVCGRNQKGFEVAVVQPSRFRVIFSVFFFSNTHALNSRYKFIIVSVSDSFS